MRIHIRALYLASVALFCTGAFADPTPWYVGVTAGQSNYRSLTDNAEIVTRSTFAPETGPVDSSPSANGRSLLGGYQLNDWFGVEFSYFDMGSASFTDAIDFCCATGNFSESLTGKQKLTGELAEVVFQSQPQGYFVFGKLGLAQAHLDEPLVHDSFSAAISTFGATRTHSSTDLTSSKVVPVYGIGLGYATDGAWTFRLGFSQFHHVGDKHTGEGDVNYLHLDMLYRF